MPDPADVRPPHEVCRELQEEIDDPNSEFADGPEQAEVKALKTLYEDPFPDIEAALLNSHDIVKYVRATGMIYPFRVWEQGENDDGHGAVHLKPASYEVPLRGLCIYWDQDGELQEKKLEKPEDTFLLKKNSIAFVTLEPTFRLPNYIAVRFNLRISHVYKGLLLGTGPLVDPGFMGRLSLPLHNLTSDDYTFRAGDGLIWMELTKISSLPTRTVDGSTQIDPESHFAAFEEGKRKLRPVKDYIHKAVGFGSVASSIPEAISQAQQQAQEAKTEADSASKEAEKSRQQAEDARQRLATIGSVGLIITVLTALGIVITVFMLTQDATKFVRDAERELNERVQNLENWISEQENSSPAGTSSTTLTVRANAQ